MCKNPGNLGHLYLCYFVIGQFFIHLCDVVFHSLNLFLKMISFHGDFLQLGYHSLKFKLVACIIV